ncbi:MAG: hypothetical protein JWN84_1650 [Nocardioides sp.]|nr:hypothetical protein [Nocardioides sp.]
MNPEDYHLEFFVDGTQAPVRDWLDELEKSDPAKRDALLYGLSQILARQGTNVCGTEFGKSLKRGLYEFRLRHTRDELQAKVQPHLGTHDDNEPTKVLLRVFFAVHGDKVVLLLNGYDKGRDPSPKRQSREIALARAHLKTWQRQQRAASKAVPSAAVSPDDVEQAKAAAEARVPADRSFLLWFRKQRQRRVAGVGKRRSKL